MEIINSGCGDPKKTFEIISYFMRKTKFEASIFYEKIANSAVDRRQFKFYDWF